MIKEQLAGEAPFLHVCIQDQSFTFHRLGMITLICIGFGFFLSVSLLGNFWAPGEACVMKVGIGIYLYSTAS